MNVLNTALSRILRDCFVLQKFLCDRLIFFPVSDRFQLSTSNFNEDTERTFNEGVL